MLRWIAMHYAGGYLLACEPVDYAIFVLYRQEEKQWKSILI